MKQSLTTKEFRATLKELIDKFDTYRIAWLENYGTEDGYNQWFSQQVLGNTHKA